MKPVWNLTKSEFTRAISTEGAEGDGLREEIAVRYGIADYEYIIRQAITEGESVDETIRKTASIKNPYLIRVKARSSRAIRSLRTFGESVARFLFE